MVFRKFAKSVLPFLMIIFILVGCTPKTTKNDIPKTTATDPVNQEIFSNPAVSRSNVLVVGVDDIEGLFNPLYSSKAVEYWVNDLVFNGLFAFDKSGNSEEVLAESYTLSEDEKTVNVILKPDILFQDGTKLIASDVVFTYSMVLDEGYNGFYQEVKDHLVSVEAISETEVVFNFRSNAGDNLKSLEIPILSEKYYKAEDFNTFITTYKEPMGTGLFKFEDYNSGESLSLSVSTNTTQRIPKLQGIVIKQLNETQAKAEFAEGKIDLFRLSADRASVVDIKALPFGQVMTQGTNTSMFIGLNLQDTLFSDEKIRRALIIGLDRQSFVQSEWEGYAEVINFMAVDNSEYAMDAQQLNPYTYDFDKASELLDASGWKDIDGDGFREKNGERMKVTYVVFPELSWSYNLAQKVQSDWRKLGIEVVLQYLDYQTMMSQLLEGTTPQMWNLAWQIRSYENPEVLFSSSETGLYNFGGYNNSIAQSLFDKLHEVNSNYEREVYFIEWHQLQNETLPVIPIARMKSVWAYNSRVKNLTIDAYGSWTGKISNIEVEVLQ